MEDSNFGKLFDIYDIGGLLRKRLGKNGDGGYVVPEGLLGKIENCVTFGVGPDVSFEISLDGIFPDKIHFDFYDHSVHGLPGVPENKKNMVFHREMVTPENAEGTLSGKDNVLLKFDIEGAEYGLTDKIKDETLDRVVFLVCEIHWVGENREKAQKILSWLGKKFVLFHLHGNNNTNNYSDIDGRKIPNVVELTLVNRKFATEAEISKESFPIPGIDFPNANWIPEMEISWAGK
jgi:hypothetical protein